MFRTPSCQLVDLIPSTDEADDLGVLCRLNDGVGGLSGCAGSAGRAQHTAQRRPCAECRGGGAEGEHLNCLWVVSQEVLDPGTGGGGELRQSAYPPGCQGWLSAE